MPDPDVLKNFITWSLVMIGWYIVSRQNSARDKRGELRKTLEAAHSLIEGLEKKGRDYWTKPYDHADTENLAFEIKLEVSRLSRLVNALYSDNRHMPSLVALKEFRQALTDGDFEEHGRIARTINDSRLRQIGSGSLLLAEEIEEGFNLKYR